MKFPISELDRQEYFDKIYNLLEDNECQIFIDTNIIALCYRLYDSARKEFFDWISLLISQNRINTPIWALNEYTNRFVRNQLEDYLSPLKKMGTINRDFIEVSNFLKMNIDDSSLRGTNYSTLSEFQEDLKIVSDKLKSISVTAKAKDDNYKLKVHNEIKTLFENTVVDSSVDDILNKVNNYGGVRYNHKLPPGFQDGEKDLNAYGDLIIWHEILETCRKNQINKAILITNDGKKDWVYAPNKLIENGRPVPNTSQLKIADPRLTYEFKQTTSSEDFFIINFDLLTQVLIQNVRGNFIQLANALQITHKQDETSEDEIVQSDQGSILESGSEPSNANEEINTKMSESNNRVEYSHQALADSEFPLFDESYSSEVILNLKNYNWYVQNPTIDSFLSSNINAVEETDQNRDKLFVIGRNLYQAACGASASAVDFIKNLKVHFLKFSDFVAVHLYSGILYEIYFDSSNRFRGDLKSAYISEVLSIKDFERLKPSIAFLDKMLEPFKQSLLYYPSKDNKVYLLIKLEEEAYNTEDWLGIITVNKDLEILEADGKNLLTEDIENSLNIYYSQLNIKGLIHLVSKSYAIPESQLEVTDKEILNETVSINFGQKRLKKLYNSQQ